MYRYLQNIICMFTPSPSKSLYFLINGVPVYTAIQTIVFTFSNIFFFFPYTFYYADYINKSTLNK